MTKEQKKFVKAARTALAQFPSGAAFDCWVFSPNY